MTQPKTDNTEEYVRLLDLLARVNDAVYVPSISDADEQERLIGSDADEQERLIGAHNLANKFTGHALTILHLSHGTVIQDLPSFKKLNFPDSASIDVLTRAAMEAFLVFHYVFFAPTKADENFLDIGVIKQQGLRSGKTY